MSSHWRTLPFICLAPHLFWPTFATSSAATSLPTCTSQASIPIYIPIRNVTLSDDTIHRGAAVSFGTPAQRLALAIAPANNNTYLNDLSGLDCGVINTRLQCSSQYGGLFDEGSSTTWSAASLTGLKTAGEFSTDQQADKWGIETLLVNSTLSIPSFPLGIFQSSGNQNILGLGHNSTMLNALVSAGAIFSRTFSIFQGWTGAHTQFQTDGSLILGGYDSTKIMGNNITQPFAMDNSCPNGLVISVTDINMNLRNGSNINIIGESHGSAMTACITPAISHIGLPEQIWWAFTNVTEVAEIGQSESPINPSGMLIPADGAYDGDLTFSIYPGLEVTIPNHQLVIPDIEIDSEGQEYPSNSTVVEVLIESLQGTNADTMPFFGKPFLSSAYLIVNNDKMQFSLSQSQPSSDSNLVAIGPPACNTPGPSPSVLASPTPNPTTNPAHGTPKGAIAGAVVGGLAIIAACIGLYFFQKRRRNGQKQEYGQVTEAISEPPYSRGGVYKISEMASDNYPLQEMPLNRDSNQDVPPYEVPDTSRLGGRGGGLRG